MRIEQVLVDTLSVPFREPVVSANHRWEARRLELVRLVTDGGTIGLGEYAAPEPEDIGADVGRRLDEALRGLHLGDPVALERALRHIGTWPFVGRVALAGVESALVDLLARHRGTPVARTFRSDAATSVPLNALIGMVSPDAAASQAASFTARGFTCLKLKGADEPAGDLEARVAAVRAAVGPTVALRVDLNGSLPATTAGAVLAGLAPFHLEYVEQPLGPTAGANALASLRRDTDVPVAADEAVRDLRSARALIEAEAVDALVIKPARVGGLRQAASIVELAAAAGVPVTISTFFESGVGIAGGLHLAAASPGHQAHGLATADLLESDLLTESLRVDAGRMTVPDGPGLGVSVDEDAVARWLV